MRLMLLLVAALPALLVGPSVPATAQAPTMEGSPLEFLTDPAGDAAWTATGETPPGSGWDCLDLRALHVQEDREGFWFTVEAASLGSIRDDLVYCRGYNLFLDHEDQSYLVEYGRGLSIRGPIDYAFLRIFDPGEQRYLPLARPEYEVDLDAGQVSLRLLRDWLLDGNGTAPTLGRAFTNIRVLSLPSSIAVYDYMPNRGAPPAPPLEVTHGVPQSGWASLHSPRPMRSSNGEATAFVYQVQATNHADREDHFALRIKNTPPGWKVQLPSPNLRIEANTTLEWPVTVSVPFAHIHGEEKRFLLEMASVNEPDSVGRVELGVRYTAVPQPAGHHDTVWLQSRTNLDDAISDVLDTVTGANLEPLAFMNADGDRTLDEGLEVAAQLVGRGVGTSTYRWNIPLEPGLDIGLDFDLERTGQVAYEATSLVPMAETSFGGRLLYILPGTDNSPPQFIPLATIETIDAGTFSGRTPIQATITPTPEADFITYHPRATLRLQLEVTGVRADAGIGPRDVPLLLPGGTMTLPLNEYHDPLNKASGLGGVTLRIAGPRERMVNPGETTLWNVTLHNDGAIEDNFQLSLDGTHTPWARLVGDNPVTVPAGKRTTLLVAVAAPRDATDQDIIDLVLTATGTRDPNALAAVRLLTFVDTLNDHPDASDYVMNREAQLDASAPKTIPGPTIGAILAGLALLRGMRTRGPVVPRRL